MRRKLLQSKAMLLGRLHLTRCPLPTTELCCQSVSSFALRGASNLLLRRCSKPNHGISELRGTPSKFKVRRSPSSTSFHPNLLSRLQNFIPVLTLEPNIVRRPEFERRELCGRRRRAGNGLFFNEPLATFYKGIWDILSCKSFAYFSIM